jgi:dihydrofolate reductase
MRKIRIMEHISLDGVIAPSGRGEDSDYANGGWSAPYRTADGAAALAEAQGSGFDLLLGRRTYDLWADFWPKITSGPFAKGLNAATKYVATPDLIVWGSSTLTSVLLEQGLVDEVLLLVYPVFLGRGKRLLSDSAEPRELALVSTKATSSGVLMNSYRPVGSSPSTQQTKNASG